MPTLAELKDRVFRLTGGVYTDTFHMTDLINDAQNQLVSSARLRGVQSVALVIGTDTYPLPATFKSPGQLLDMENPDSIIPYELVDVSENRAGYAIEGGNIIIKPIPQDTRTLTHYYQKYAALLVDDANTPEIDAQYHDLLSTYAAGMIMLQPQLEVNKALADRLLARWDEGKQNFLGDMQRKNKSARGRTVNNW